MSFYSKYDADDDSCRHQKKYHGHNDLAGTVNDTASWKVLFFQNFTLDRIFNNHLKFSQNISLLFKEKEFNEIQSSNSKHTNYHVLINKQIQ